MAWPTTSGAGVGHRHLDGGVPARGEHRAAAVARDREQPGPHGRGRRGLAKSAIRAQERLLQRVLAVLAVAEHVPAERQQRGVMAIVEDLERTLVARAHQRRQALVVELDRPTGPDAMPKNARHCEEDATAYPLVPAGRGATV